MKFAPALRRLLIAVRGRTEAYVKQAAMPMCWLRRLAAQLTGASRRLNLRQLRSGMRRCATAGLSLPSCSWFASPWLSSFQSVAAVAPLLRTKFGVSLADIGILIGLKFTPGVALAWPGGAIGRRFGDKTTVLAAPGSL